MYAIADDYLRDGLADVAEAQVLRMQCPHYMHELVLRLFVLALERGTRETCLASALVDRLHRHGLLEASVAKQVCGRLASGFCVLSSVGCGVWGGVGCGVAASQRAVLSHVLSHLARDVSCLHASPLQGFVRLMQRCDDLSLDVRRRDAHVRGDSVCSRALHA